MTGWLARRLAQLLLLVGWLAIGLASCSWLAAWLAACCVADEADEGDDSGCGWLAGNQTKNPYMRRTSRRDAGRPADINHRCTFRSSHSSYSDPVQGRLEGRAIAAIK